MGKETRLIAVTLRSYVCKFGVFVTDDKVLVCSVCEDKVSGSLDKSSSSISKTAKFSKKLCRLQIFH